MPFEGALAAATGNQLGPLPQLRDECLNAGTPAYDVFGLLEGASQHGHGGSLLGPAARSGMLFA